MGEHILSSFDEDLRVLEDKISRMGGLVEEQCVQSLNALESRDGALADRVVSGDSSVDAIESEIENLVILTIIKRQPVAGDLRHIISSVKIAAELERIGDLSKNIAKRALLMSDNLVFSVSRSVMEMHFLTLSQLRKVLDSYAVRDSEKALEVWRDDARIDEACNVIFRDLLSQTPLDQDHFSAVAHMLFVSKNIERIGDHCTNIAEYVYYLTEGCLPQDDRPKIDVMDIST